MTKVLFVCTGNICRSPMAEAVLRKKIEDRGLSDEFEVDSAGLISYHAGEQADPRALAELGKHGIPYEGRSRQIIKDDMDEFDHILVMTEEHKEELLATVPRKYWDKIRLLLDYSDNYDGEVPDPYYAGGFAEVFDMVDDAAEGFLKSVTNNQNSETG